MNPRELNKNITNVNKTMHQHNAQQYIKEYEVHNNTQNKHNTKYKTKYTTSHRKSLPSKPVKN
jgi:hypothetical protein